MQPSLQHENYSLRQQLETLLNEARENERKLRRFDQLERQLIASSSLADLVVLLLRDYRQAFALESVSLSLVDRSGEVRRILEECLGGDIEGLLLHDNPDALAAQLGALRQPTLAAFNPAFHADLFANTEVPIASVACLPLIRQDNLIGCLHLGSADPSRYTPTDGIEFLDRLAVIIGICIESTLTQERLKQAGLTDGLTGVQNRRYFEHRCPIEVSQLRRHQQPLACMFLDIDKFKRINDTHGHQTGDDILRGVAQAIQSQLRTGDTIARYGGEEFVVLLPQTAPHYAREIAERIRRTVAARGFVAVSGTLVPTTLSIGLSVLTAEEAEHGVDGATLIARADAALYQAKHNGRNQVVSDSCQPDARHAHQRLSPASLWRKLGEACSVPSLRRLLRS